MSETFQTRRTRSCGRVLHVWVVEGGGKVVGVWKTIPDTKNATPVSRFRVRVVEWDARTPERVLVDAFWCSRRGRGEGTGTLERALVGTF